MRGISWLAEKRLTSQEGLCCMEYGVRSWIVTHDDATTLARSVRRDKDIRSASGFTWVTESRGIPRTGRAVYTRRWNFGIQDWYSVSRKVFTNAVCCCRSWEYCNPLLKVASLQRVLVGMRSVEHVELNGGLERKDRCHLGDVGVDGKIILKWILQKSVRSTWTDLAEDRDIWRAVVNVAVNFRVS